MVVWVKEISGKLTIEIVRQLLKEEIHVKAYNDEPLCLDDYLIVSIDDDSINRDKIQTGTVLVYEDILEQISKNIQQELSYNYDYYYLMNAMNEAKKDCIDTIITGSSYGLYGIDRTQLTSAVNLSLPSQDLFYAYKEIEEICLVNKNIRNVVLCCSYYYLFSDLSRTQNVDELSRVSKVYFPLLGYLHNCACPPYKVDILMSSEIFDIERIMVQISIEEYERTYFHGERSRHAFAVKEWLDKSKKWEQLTEEEKTNAGRKRAKQHNSQINYQDTFLENQAILARLSDFCTSKGLNLVIIVTPMSRYYRDSTLEEFQSIFYETLDEIEGEICLIDLYDDPTYVDEDFNDTDHLSESGAEKMTAELLGVLEKING